MPSFHEPGYVVLADAGRCFASCSFPTLSAMIDEEEEEEEEEEDLVSAFPIPCTNIACLTYACSLVLVLTYF